MLAYPIKEDAVNHIRSTARYSNDLEAMVTREEGALLTPPAKDGTFHRIPFSRFFDSQSLAELLLGV
jgi:hypothetical protein